MGILQCLFLHGVLNYYELPVWAVHYEASGGWPRIGSKRESKITILIELFKKNVFITCNPDVITSNYIKFEQK